MSWRTLWARMVYGVEDEGRKLAAEVVSLEIIKME